MNSNQSQICRLQSVQFLRFDEAKPSGWIRA